MRILTLLATAIGLVVGGPTASAQGPKIVLNTKNGLALEGFDPVSYFTASAPVKGQEAISAKHLGATYSFATAEHRDRFVVEPAKEPEARLILADRNWPSIVEREGKSTP